MAQFSTSWQLSPALTVSLITMLCLASASTVSASFEVSNRLRKGKVVLMQMTFKFRGRIAATTAALIASLWSAASMDIAGLNCIPTR
ncbi:hypothetical protein [Streptomyces sp. NPDC005407]|uniref:hypothetical protein n=1 Tax=Streptomyces sp. NPDC005407 TaxID=3155340 RepID=UPI0033AB459E